MRTSIPLFPASSKPFGEDYGRWSAKWWQWLLSIPKTNNPAFDSTGRYAGIYQTDPKVFFLCQTLEATKAVTTRECMIDSGRAILMPIINWISILHLEGSTDQEMMSIAKEKMDMIDYMQVEVDELEMTEELFKYRTTSPFFSIILPKNNIMEIFHSVQSGVELRAVSEGYWLFIRPLLRTGKLRIHTLASSTASSLKIEVNYQVEIV